MATALTEVASGSAAAAPAEDDALRRLHELVERARKEAPAPALPTPLPDAEPPPKHWADDDQDEEESV